MKSKIAKIFDSRKSQIGRKLKAAALLVTELTHKLSETRRRLEEYRAYRIQREKELYDELFESVASTRELELCKGKVGNLLAYDATFENEITSLEGKLSAAEKDLIKLRQAFLKAAQKFDNWTNYVAESTAKENLKKEICAEDDLDLHLSQEEFAL